MRHTESMNFFTWELIPRPVSTWFTKRSHLVCVHYAFFPLRYEIDVNVKDSMKFDVWQG
jgi:hypothetical protein